MKNTYKTHHIFILLVILSLILITNLTLSQWVITSNISAASLSSVKFFDSNTGITVGTNGIWRTVNGGYNWIHVLSSSKLNSLSFYNQLEGMAIGDSGKIYRTTDNGISWEQLNSGIVLNLNSIAVTPPGKSDNTELSIYFACIVGQNGVFLRSFNSGSTWTISTAFTQDLYYLFLLPTATGFAVGASNCEYFTTTANGGTNWLAILNTTNGGYHLYSGAYLGQNTSLAVGSNGRLRRTTNWGYSWTLPVSNTTFDLYAITFADVNTGWLCGQNGFIERSTNGGQNWAQQFAPNYSHLRSISFINNLTGWIVGDNGVVLRTDNGGITGVQNKSSEIPNELKLYQNYPNPFNPITKIRFELKKGGRVKLIIYDTKGIILKELINQFKLPGKYNIEFNGNDYASGIYFYKIEIDNFTDCKKMVLIK